MRARWIGVAVGLSALVVGSTVVAAGSKPDGHHARASRTTSKPSTLLQKVDSASDPGLPAVVGTVDGVPISSKVMAETEYVIHVNSGGKVGSTAVRTKAFNLLVRQQLETRKAKSLHLLPSLAVAKRQAVARELPTTMNELRAIQENDGIRALSHKIEGAAQGESAKKAATLGKPGNPITGVGSAAWRAYVKSLVRHATVHHTKF